MELSIIIQIICISIVALLIPIIGIFTIIAEWQKIYKGRK